MKVTCPGCGWSAEVPDEKIPAEGGKGTCPKCQVKFEVVRQPETKAMFDCPKCEFTQEISKICVNCGVEFSKYDKNLAAIATINAYGKVIYTIADGIIPSYKQTLNDLQLSHTKTGLLIQAINDKEKFGRFYPLHVLDRIHTSTELWTLHITVIMKTGEQFKIYLVNGDEKKRFKEVILPFTQKYIPNSPIRLDATGYQNDVIDIFSQDTETTTANGNNFKELELIGDGRVASCILKKDTITLRQRQIVSTGELVMSINQIASVMLNGPGLSGPAIIFAPTGFTGYRPPKVVMEAMGDDYSVVFNMKHYKVAAKIRDYIVNYNSKNTNEPNQAASPADEILKFKKLFDDGVLTEDEFAAKKKQLLNL